MLGKRESYKPRPSSDGVGAQIPYYARKDFLDCHFPEEWEIAIDAEINPFKDVLVFRRICVRMVFVAFSGALESFATIEIHGSIHLMKNWGRSTGYSLKDKNKAKPNKTESEIGKSAKNQSRRKAKIAVGERITRSVFGVKGVNLGDEESPYWTMIGKKESYKPRPSSDGVGAQTPYYARKRILRCLILLGEWKISRDDEINPFKDVLVFRRMVEFLGAIPINLKSNMWESEDLIENPINWDKPPKDGDGAWHAKIWIIDPDGKEFVTTLQSIPTIRKLSERKIPREIINLDYFYDT
ncbi:hypothetical protein Tco_0481858 [Tanacetum coccineum]